MTPSDLMSILEELDIPSLNRHLRNGDVFMKDLEDQLINGIELNKDCDELFTLFIDDKPVNTVNDQYLYNCGFGFPK